MHQAEIQSTNAPLLIRLSLSHTFTHSLTFSLPQHNTKDSIRIFVIEEFALLETAVFLCYIQNLEEKKTLYIHTCVRLYEV